MRFIVAFCFAFFFNFVSAFAMPPVMHLDEVKPGMTGIAQTVVDSTGTIRSFNIEIVGTIDNGKGSSPYIMARASGDVINMTGGVLQGMSGSPIYIGGKLVGALSAGFKDMDPFTFLITPIDDMVKIWNFADNFKLNPYSIPEEVEEEIPEDDENILGNEINPDEDAEISNIDYETYTEEKNLANDDEKALIIYNGFSGRGLDFLKDSLSDFGLNNFSLAANSSNEPVKFNFSPDLFPGSPFGVAVVFGDFLVGATGTLTAIDGNNILGFGHSFTHGGNVNFFMTDASIIGAVKGTSNGMKIASVGSLIGRVNQDRDAGIGGILGQFPSVVPISVSVNDENYSAIIAYNENLIPKLGAAIAYSALAKKADNLAESTVKVNFDIKTNVAPDGNLNRQNVYYSSSDVGQLAVSELLQALTLVSTNPSAESNIFGIDVQLNFTNDRKTASLISATPNKQSVKPGEEVNLKVKLQPYRGTEVLIDVPYTVPITAREGNFVLDIHGGGLVPVTAIQQVGVILPSTKPPKDVYDEKIQQLINSNKNNELIIKPAVVVKTEKELAAEIQRTKKLAKRLQKLGIKPSAAKPTKFETEYIIDNVIQCSINVSKL